MTEAEITPEDALTLLVGAWARWVRDSPFCPDDLWEFFERVLGPSGWSPERVLAAIPEADRVIPDGDAENHTTIGECLRAIGLGSLLHDPGVAPFGGAAETAGA